MNSDILNKRINELVEHINTPEKRKKKKIQT